jgi:polyisoprenoid-binding protein YceI
MRHRAIRAAVAALLLAGAPARADEAAIVARRAAGEAVRFDVAEGSWVEYEVPITTLFGTKQDIVGRSTQVSGSVTWSASGVAGELRVPTTSLDTGNPVRDGHVRAMLEAERHPTLHLRLLDLRAAPVAGASSGRYEVAGVLTVAGREALVAAPVQAVFGEEVLEADGEAELAFSELRMDPPTLLGVVKQAGERLRLRAHLRVRIVPPVAAAARSAAPRPLAEGQP